MSLWGLADVGAVVGAVVAGFVVGFHVDFSGCGLELVLDGGGVVAVRLCDGDADGVREADRDVDGVADVGAADVGGTGEFEMASGTCGMDGSVTDGCRAASAGPTARTAIQTTNRTRIATAKLRTNRAGPNRRTECLEGNG
ncbi:hypothetical protein ACQP2X_05155 [Actinoplanes sp. CA-131856]